MITDFLYSDLTGQVLKAYYSLFYKLGPHRRGYSEATLVQMLRLDLQALGLQVAAEVPITIRHQGQRVTTHYADLVVEYRVVVEIKKVLKLAPEHGTQLDAYLLHGGYAVGLLLNFGGSKPLSKRHYQPAHDPTRRGGGPR